MYSYIWLCSHKLFLCFIYFVICMNTFFSLLGSIPLYNALYFVYALTSWWTFQLFPTFADYDLMPWPCMFKSFCGLLENKRSSSYRTVALHLLHFTINIQVIFHICKMVNNMKHITILNIKFLLIFKMFVKRKKETRFSPISDNMGLKMLKKKFSLQWVYVLQINWQWE